MTHTAPNEPVTPFYFTDGTYGTDGTDSEATERKIRAHSLTEIAYQCIPPKGTHWRLSVFQLSRRAVALGPITPDETDGLIDFWIRKCPEPPPKLDALSYFSRLLDEIKRPIYAHEKFIELVNDEAHNMIEPQLAKRYLPHVRHLIRICMVLQRLNPDTSFHLSCRFAADLLTKGGTPVSHTAAADTLRMLVNHKVLTLADPGNNRRARRYRLAHKITAVCKDLPTNTPDSDIPW